jgi:hypothetical protein
MEDIEKIKAKIGLRNKNILNKTTMDNVDETLKRILELVEEVKKEQALEKKKEDILELLKIREEMMEIIRNSEKKGD